MELRKRKLLQRNQMGLAPETLRKRMKEEFNVGKLDLSLRNEIERRMIEDDSVKGTETKEQYFERLRHVALTLPRDLVKRCLLQVKDKIVATVASHGQHIAMD